MGIQTGERTAEEGLRGIHSEGELLGILLKEGQRTAGERSLQRREGAVRKTAEGAEPAVAAAAGEGNRQWTTEGAERTAAAAADWQEGIRRAESAKEQE